VRILRAGPVPRGPVVFCHGMLAYSMLRMQISEDHNSFASVRKFLEERGCRVLFPRVLPTGGVAERARQLRDQIVRWTDEPVNLIAHSMGGLDCRFLITHLDMAERVRSLTTIATPHRGSYLADWFLDNYRNRFPLLRALEAVGVNLDGFRDCRPSICAQFNATTPDVPKVRYFSYAGEVPQWKVTPVLRRAWAILTAAEGPNDAMVSVTSARRGEFLGTICADHFAQTPDGLFVRAAEDFDSLGFCTRVVEELARRGF
jgi:triacylglycerol lipase